MSSKIELSSSESPPGFEVKRSLDRLQLATGKSDRAVDKNCLFEEVSRINLRKK